MSLIGSLLSLAIIPLRANPRNPKPKEADNLAVMALADEVKRLQFALDHWRNAGTALMEENERLRAELQDARAQLDPTSPYYRYTDRQRHAQNVALAQQMLAQQHLQHQSYHGLGQLQHGMQNYAGCTCVPGRSHALTRNFNK